MFDRLFEFVCLPLHTSVLSYALIGSCQFDTQGKGILSWEIASIRFAHGYACGGIFLINN